MTARVRETAHFNTRATQQDLSSQSRAAADGALNFEIARCENPKPI